GFFLDELETFRARGRGRLAVTVALSDEDVPDSLAAAPPGFAFDRGLRSCGRGRLAVPGALSDEDVPDSLAAAYPGFAFARGFVHAVAGERMKGRFAGIRAYVAGAPPMGDARLRPALRE